MTGSEVTAFILPQLDDPIQITFLLIILVMMAGTVISAHLTARTVSWEKKWNRGTPDDVSDDLDIEHGSVTDLHHAVATAPEKVAEIMPGMLLVIGLLGTFLGLGLALNKASSILGQADAMSAGAAADSMNHLMGLLQGLGTKFKTSTWGITGFVLLKIWSEVTRFEEKRLAWVICKVKTELEKRKREELSVDARNRESLHEQIGLAANKIVAGLVEQIGKLLILEKGHQQQFLKRLDNLHEGQEKLQQEIHSIVTTLYSEINKSSTQLSLELQKQTNQTVAQAKMQHQQIIEYFGKTHNELIVEMKCGTEILNSQMKTSAEKVVSNFQEQERQKLEQKKVQHLQLLERFDTLRMGQGELREEQRATKEAMVQFSDSMRSVVERMAEASQRTVDGAEKIGSAADRMGLGADKVGNAADGLIHAVNEFQQQFTNVLNDVRRDLGGAIQHMSEQAAGTLEKGSTRLSDATKEISTALGVLSSDVRGTMGEVKESINNALKIQRKAADEFTLSSNALNENIVETTNIVGNLAKPITDGLRAVSEAGQRMRSVGQSVDKSLEAMESIVERLASLADALKPLEYNREQHDEVIKSLTQLNQILGNQQHIVQEIKGVRSDLVTQQISKDKLFNSLDGIQRISEHIDKLCDALKPISLSGEQHRETMSALAVLNHLPINQQQIIHEMKGLRSDLNKPPVISS